MTHVESFLEHFLIRQKDIFHLPELAHKLYLHNTLKHIYNVYLSRLEQQELELTIY